MKRKLVDYAEEDTDTTDSTSWRSSGSRKRVIRVGDRVNVQRPDGKYHRGVVTIIDSSGLWNKHLVRFDDGKMQSDVLKKDIIEEVVLDDSVPKTNAKPVTRS